MTGKDWLYDKPVAHRGLWGDEIVENTMEAFIMAVQHDFNIELDVQLTKDNQLVVFHDDTLLRKIGIDKRLDEFTFDELQRVRFFDNETARIPLFTDVCNLCAGKVGIMIEIKKNPGNELTHEVEDVLLDILQDYDDLDYIVKSFNPFAVDYVGRVAPHVRRGLLSSKKSIDEYKDYERPMVEKLLYSEDNRVDFFDYKHTNIGSELFNSVYNTMPLFVWTVNNEERYEELRGTVDNVIFEGFIPKS